MDWMFPSRGHAVNARHAGPSHTAIHRRLEPAEDRYAVCVGGSARPPAPPPPPWPAIDPGLLEDGRPGLPAVPLKVFPHRWREWVSDAAHWAGSSEDYGTQALGSGGGRVVAALL
jgi:hypothetical protein